MTRQAHLPGFANQPDRVSFEASRVVDLSRLNKFLGRAGLMHDFEILILVQSGAKTYRNCRHGSWHRLISEEEALRATLARHSPMAAEKFVQEVFWRSYFKGWLEHHPSVWTHILPENKFMLLITEEDCGVETWLHRTPACIVESGAPQQRSPCRIGLPAQSIANGAVQDALARANLGSKHLLDASNCTEDIISTAQKAGIHTVVCPYATTGPGADVLKNLGTTLMAAGIDLRQVRRAHDDLVWTCAKTGFYGVRRSCLKPCGTLICSARAP